MTASNASGMGMNNFGGMNANMQNMNMPGGGPSMHNLRFTPQQLQQLSMMSPEDRSKAMQRAMMSMQQQVQQQAALREQAQREAQIRALQMQQQQMAMNGGRR